MEIPEDIAGEIENYEAIDQKEKQSMFWISYEFLGKKFIFYLLN